MTQIKGYPRYSPEYFMNEALKEATKAFEKDEVPVGAIVVCRRTIIARAHNLTETLKDVTAHAEMQAFTAATAFLGGKYLSECELYVTLEPCLMCAAASSWAQLGQLFYGASDEKKGFMIFGTRALHPKTIVHKGVFEDECSEILKLFFKNKRLST